MPVIGRHCFWTHWRNYIAFWFFGLLNNFIYVIMLSAAVDLIHRNHPGELNSLRHKMNCTKIGTGVVLLADIGPGLFLKALAPFFIERIHAHLKVGLSATLSLSALLIVSFSKSVSFIIFGIACASLSCGLGDVTFLTIMAFFDTRVVSSWASGTGAAGIVGSLFYAGLTSFIPPDIVLQTAVFVPLLMLIVYFFVLEKPQLALFRLACFGQLWPSRAETPYTPIPENIDPSGGGPTTSPSPASTGAADSGEDRVGEQSQRQYLQVSLSWETKRRILWAILPLIVYLAMVYFFEYLINQTLFELIQLEGTSLSPSQQYRWYQFVYQCGVFVSRSSLKLCEFRRTWILAILQAINFVVFLLQVVKPFISNIGIIFALIVYEGVLGGLSYVNTFHRILTKSHPTSREFSMSVAAFSDALGITGAAFLAIPLHNWLCK